MVFFTKKIKKINFFTKQFLYLRSINQPKILTKKILL